MIKHEVVGRKVLMAQKETNLRENVKRVDPLHSGPTLKTSLLMHFLHPTATKVFVRDRNIMYNVACSIVHAVRNSQATGPAFKTCVP
jgi:hypothetical protein